MVDKLEACTWCGHEGVLHSSSDGEVEWVRCVHCGRESPLAYSAAEAIKRWNAGEVRDAKPTPANGEQVERGLRDALGVAKRAILKAAQDTLWCDDCPVETVVDRIDAAIAEADGQQTLDLATPTEDARSRVKVLEEALGAIRDGDVPRPVTFQWRADGKPSRLDQCKHGVTMNEDCAGCITEFVDTALGNKETDRHG